MIGFYLKALAHGLVRDRRLRPYKEVLMIFDIMLWVVLDIILKFRKI